MLKEGKKCYGAKYKGQIVAFTWVSLDESNYEWHKLQLKENEAYLFDMHTAKAFRGKNIAPYLRYQSYRVLKNMGRNKFYSISQFFNTPSKKFKKKLNAKFLGLHLTIRLFKKYKWNWKLKDYKT